MIHAAILVIPWALGCGDARPQTPAAAPDGAPASAFDPTTSGTIRGRVSWEGPVPEVPAFKIHSNLFPGKDGLVGLVRERPNLPQVDSVGKGVAQAVLFLRGVDPNKSRPWDHPPVSIEIRDMRLRVLQGGSSLQTGFVQRGGQLNMISHDRSYHSLHADGADYFTFTLADPDLPRERRLERAGLIEFSSASGCYWMRGYLFVSDHAYYTHSGTDGRFQLDHVPAGTYQLSCWLPNWNVVRQERDPESCLVNRLFLAKPLEQQQTVTVEAGAARTIDFTVSAAAFLK
jgi:hypothetical protein